jgi:DNA polymerase-3 subunit delta
MEKLKYTNLSAFEGHLGDSPICLVCCAHDADRKMILEKLAAKLQAEQKRFDSADLKEDILPLTRELSLFGSKRVFLAFEVQLEEEDLNRYLQSPSPNTYLFLGSKTSKNIPGALYLDLSHEKPWDREKRLLGSLRQLVVKAGKNIAPDLLVKLIARVGSDWSLLESEVEKLITFVGTRHEILLADLESISSESKEQSSWQLSEEIVWGKGMPFFPPLETSQALALIGALRFQIQLGWQLCSSPLDAPPLHVKPYQAQKYGKLAHAKSLDYFEKAILGLFEVEKLLKSTSLDPRLLFSRYVANLAEFP